MTTPLFHHTFTPLRNGIVASEAAWKKPGKWERDADKAMSWYRAASGTYPRPERPRVLVAGDDLFAENEEPFESLEGLIATRADILSRLCSIIDACPNLTFCLRTRHAENVMRMMPPIGRNRIPDDENGIPTANPLKRPNLILMAECHDQRDIDRQVPHLLQCRELCGVIGVHAVPSEAMNLRDYLKMPGMPDRIVKPHSVPVEYIPVVGIDWLTISGSGCATSCSASAHGDPATHWKAGRGSNYREDDHDVGRTQGDAREDDAEAAQSG